MRFVADENSPRPAVAALREQGFDLAWIAEDCPGVSDEQVLERCTADSRTLLTLDKDFGELAFRRGLAADSGVILVRIATRSPEEVVSIVLAALQARDDWSGHFSVITRDRIRVRPFPGRR